MIKLLFTLSLLISPYWVHDYHVAVTQVNWTEKARTLEITHKVFYDDLEKAILEQSGIKLLLGTKQESSKAKQFIGSYLADNFKLKHNNEECKLRYLGFEQENDLIFAFFESERMEAPKRINVFNTILFKHFSDQANLVHFSISGTKKSLFLNERNPTETSVF